jgi:hypothetical protein
MDPMLEKIVVVLVFAMVLLFVNIKAGQTWLKVISIVPMLACLAVAGWLVFRVVFGEA